MTKKRFTFDSILPNVIKIMDGEKCLTGEDIVDCLNALHEENKALKQTIKKMGELGGFNKHMIKTICGDLE